MPAGNKRRVICILGMHRSGTSAFGGVLSALGVDMGRDLIGARADNPKGFYENRRVVQLNDRVMKSLGSWSGSFLPLPDDRWDSDALHELRAKAISVIKSQYGDKSDFGIKDPRLCRLLPFWLRVFNDMGIEPYFIIVLRNPLETADSLLIRDGAATEKSLMVWASHSMEAEHYSRGFPRVFVTFDDLIDDPQKVVADISGILGLEFPKSFESAKTEIRCFLDAKLKHHTADEGALDGYLNGIFGELFRALSGLAYRREIVDDELRRIDDIRNAYRGLRAFFYYPGFDVDAIYQRLYFGEGLEGISSFHCFKLFVLAKNIRNWLLPPHSRRREMLTGLRKLLEHPSDK